MTRRRGLVTGRARSATGWCERQVPAVEPAEVGVRPLGVRRRLPAPLARGGRLPERRTYDAEVALDLTAETFAQALKGCHRFRGETADDERAWLIGIAKHLHAQYVRKGVAESRAVRRLGLQLPRPDATEQARVIELAGGAELRAAVAAQLEALNADQRTAVHLRVVEELPYPEIAARLGVSEQTVRARVSRGLRTIAAELERRQIPTEPEPAR